VYKLYTFSQTHQPPPFIVALPTYTVTPGSLE
jgi:hypothetical protein